MDMERLLQQLRTDPAWRDRIVHWEVLAPEHGRYGDFPAAVHPALQAALRARGIERLYDHQTETFEAAVRGAGFIAATPTASGKTLCYNLPVLSDILRADPPTAALYLFPTKALSQDQVAELTDLIGRLPASVVAYTYDGDTPPAVRRRIRDRGDIVVTNPYMLHTGILPNHPKWGDFFRKLRYVVIDEVHVYRGIFGGHMANVLRRLGRIARHYGQEPAYLLASATLRNPGELAERLTGRPLPVVRHGGSPRAEKHFLVLNPPLVNAPAGVRGSALEEARRLAGLLMGVKSIFFARSRNRVEVLVKYLKDLYHRRGKDPDRVRGYRGGYLPRLRRMIEADLRAGRVDAVVSTTALELGVDIGSLDAAVLVGYPGSLASAWQQAGRAGRRCATSAAFLILSNQTLDQYLGDHPDYLFRTPREQAILDADNLVVRANHLKCAAFELPFGAEEAFGGGVETRAILDHLATESALLSRSGDTYHWAADAYPAEDVSLNSADIDNFVILEERSGPRGLETRVLAEVDRPGAMTSIYPGAIYGHQGEQFQIARLDYAGRRAYARKIDADYYTDAELSTDIRITRIDREAARAGRYVAHHGGVITRTQAAVYKKIKFYTSENVGAGAIDLPAEEMDTTAWWAVIPTAAAAAAGLYEAGGGGGLQAMANLLRGVAPLYLGCDPADLRPVAEVSARDYQAPTVFLYDALPGGVGLGEALFLGEPEVLEAALERVERCPCRTGCPGCIGPVRAGGRRDKEVARRLLAHMVGRGERAPAASCEETRAHEP
ncbi:MAG: DEAD/DEAH box helicase [Planctomycetes bacterium]|nr:DEAD/DEAH box helicase [Planctomycetota bacterium]